MRVLSKNTFYIETVGELMEGTGNDCIVNYELVQSFGEVGQLVFFHKVTVLPLGVPPTNTDAEYFNTTWHTPNITDLILKTISDDLIGFRFDGYKTIHLCEDLVDQQG